MKFYTLTNDHLFKRIFMEEKYLKILLEDLFEEKVNTIKYINPELVINNKQEKAGIVDLLLEIDGDIVILELQNINKYNFEDRLLYYTSNIICSHGLRKGEDYANLKKVKAYAIINYELSKELEQTIHLKVEETNNLFLNKVEYKILDLTKIDENKKGKKYYELVNLFKNADLEKLKEIIKSEEYKEILEKMEIYNQDEKEYQKMEDIYKMMMNEKPHYETSYKAGVDAGFNQGKALGISEGKNNEKRVIAKNMLEGNVDIDLISKYTNLSIGEINALR